MRICLVAFGLLALAVSGCSSTDPQQTAPAATSTTTSTPTRAADPAAETKDRAFAYYTSQVRRERFDAFFATDGKRYAEQLVRKEIPSKTRGWAKGEGSRPPANGYGVIESDNGGDTNKPYLGAIVCFRDGKVDLSEPVLGIFVIKGNRVADVDGKLIPRVDGTTMSNNPDAYSWRIDASKPSDSKGFTISKRDGGAPNPDYALDPHEKYTVQSRADFTDVITEADISAGDDMLFAEMRTTFAVNPSDWR